MEFFVLECCGSGLILLESAGIAHMPATGSVCFISASQPKRLVHVHVCVCVCVFIQTRMPLNSRIAKTSMCVLSVKQAHHSWFVCVCVCVCVCARARVCVVSVSVPLCVRARFPGGCMGVLTS